MGSHDDDEREQRRENAARNRLGPVGAGWILWHVWFLCLDALALKEVVTGEGRAREAAQQQGSGWAPTHLLFGGHSQFIGCWSVALSILSHTATLWAMVSVDPYPVQFVLRERARRDRVYNAAARCSALATCFCPVAALCSVALAAFGEREWGSAAQGGGDGWFPYLYVDAAVALDKLVCLVLQVPRHWSCGPGRYISRRDRYMEVDVGQSRVHAALSLYMAWLAVCRLRNGAWAYSTLAGLELGAGTAVNHLFQLLCIVVSVQMAGWLSWFCAACVAPKPIL